MFGLTVNDHIKRKTRKRKQRITKRRIVIAFLLLAAFGRIADASAPASGIVFEDCSIRATSSATQAQAQAFAVFGQIPDDERMEICMLIDPDFPERFDN